MKKNYTLSDEEKALFKKAVQGVTPLKAKSVAIPPNTPKIQPLNKKIEKFPDLDVPIFKPTHRELFPEKDYLFVRSGIQKTVIRKLKAGLIHFDSSIDLHGLTISRAEQVIPSYLDLCFKNHCRYIKIIHGKSTYAGENIAPLKNLLYQCLVETPQVLAFCTATSHDGGTGATYILLKRIFQTPSK